MHKGARQSNYTTSLNLALHFASAVPSPEGRGHGKFTGRGGGYEARPQLSEA